MKNTIRPDDKQLFRIKYLNSLVTATKTIVGIGNVVKFHCNVSLGRFLIENTSALVKSWLLFNTKPLPKLMMAKDK